MTMNCPLRYRKIGVGHGSEASLLMQKPSKKQTLRMLILLYGGLTLRILRKAANRLYAKLSVNEKL